jgi:pyruvate/2-oxoglutarate dehydrogenase complex dihydrolipoamide acyltransferase (E2) component
MSSVAMMPQVGESPTPGRVIKVHRMPGHYVDDGEPVINLRVGRHILTICAPTEGLSRALLKFSGGSVDTYATFSTDCAMPSR